MSTSPIPPILDQDRYAVYQPTAATTDFALGFPLFGDAGDVAVVLDGAPLTLTADYTVRSATKGATLTPAPVTDAFVRLNTPISAGKLEIYGNFRPRRTIQATAPYGTRDFNFSFSLLMAVLREMWSQFTRAIQAPVGETSLTLPSKGVRSGQVLGFDGNGNPVAVGDYASIATGAVTATAAAERAEASATAAAKFDPSKYSTTEQISDALNAYVEASRKVKTGAAFLLNGVAGTDVAPAEADLSADLLFKLIFASTAATIEGTRDDLPVHPAGMKAAIDDALTEILASLGAPAPSGVPFVMTASGNYSPSAGTKLLLGILCGGGGQGGGGGSGGGGGGGGGGCCVFLVKVTDGSTFAVSIGAAGSGGSSNQNGIAGNVTSVTIDGVTYTANGGAGGVKAGSGSGTPYQGGAGGASVNGLFGFVGNDGSNGSSTAVGSGGKPSAPAAEAATYGRGGNGVTSGSGLVGTGGFAKFVEFK